MTEATSTLLPALTDRIVKDHILPKVLEPITTPMPLEVANANTRLDFSTLLCMFQYMDVNKAWREGFQETTAWNAFRLAKHDLEVLMSSPRFRLMNRRSFERAFLENFRMNRVWFSSSWRLCRPFPMRMQTESLHAMPVWELRDLRDRLEHSFQYWKSRDRRRRGWRNVANFWITPADRVVP